MYEINTFVAYFDNRINRIRSIGNLEFRRILYMTVFDALSKIPEKVDNVKGVKKRFTYFVSTYSPWVHWNKVSTVQLYIRLLSNPILRSHKITMKISDIVEGWASKVVLIKDVDRFFNDYKKEYSDLCQDIETLIKECTFSELFYKLRNYLVHESREPSGMSRLLEEKDEPYYSRKKTPIPGVHPGRSAWQLGIPISFVDKQLEGCLKNLKEYLERNSINPYDCYDFDLIW
jgi:hypothetical protein